MWSSLLVILLLISIGSAAAVVRKTKGPWFAWMPFLLEFSIPLFICALWTLPFALRYLFERLLGHSVDARITRSWTMAGGATATETSSWLLEVWTRNLRFFLILSISLGFLWALFNLFKTKNRFLNGLACAIFLAWACFFLDAIASTAFP